MVGIDRHLRCTLHLGRAVCLLGILILGLVRSAPPVKAEDEEHGECRAEVEAVGFENSCPSAKVRFHIAVEGCTKGSSGTFDYKYTATDKRSSRTIPKSSHWNNGDKEFDQTEYPSLACDESIQSVESNPVSCSCS